MTKGTLEERARKGIELAPAALKKLRKYPPVLRGNAGSASVAVVKSRWDEIVAFRKQGFSAYAIARQLETEGVPFKADTLSRAIARLEVDGVSATAAEQA